MPIDDFLGNLTELGASGRRGLFPWTALVLAAVGLCLGAYVGFGTGFGTAAGYGAAGLFLGWILGLFLRGLVFIGLLVALGIAAVVGWTFLTGGAG